MRTGTGCKAFTSCPGLWPGCRSHGQLAEFGGSFMNTLQRAVSDLETEMNETHSSSEVSSSWVVISETTVKIDATHIAITQTRV